MGSGKNTVGDIIEKICLTNEGPVFEQKSFAGKLKQIASLLTGIPVEKFEDQEFKKTLLSPEWGTIHTNPLNSIPVFEDVRFLHMMSVRELLQKLGTEAMRDGLHENVWVNALFADYKSKRELLQADGTWIESDTGEVDFAVSIKYPKWIITDMRFPNEMDAIKERGGITIRVVRPHGYTNPHTGVYKEMPLSYHPSETALDEATFDYEIINDGEIVDLIEKVKTILIKEKII
jgi:hypothetical protein